MTETARATLMQAAEVLKRDDRRTACQLIRQVLRSDPHNADAWYLASYLSYAAEERIAVLEQAVKYNPSHPMARRALERARADDTAFSDLTAPTWTPDFSALSTTPVPNDWAAWKPILTRLLFVVALVVSSLIATVLLVAVC